MILKYLVQVEIPDEAQPASQEWREHNAEIFRETTRGHLDQWINIVDPLKMFPYKATVTVTEEH